MILRSAFAVSISILQAVEQLKKNGGGILYFPTSYVSGNAYRGPRNQVPAMDAHLGLLGLGSD